MAGTFIRCPTCGRDLVIDEELAQNFKHIVFENGNPLVRTVVCPEMFPI